MPWPGIPISGICVWASERLPSRSRRANIRNFTGPFSIFNNCCFNDGWRNRDLHVRHYAPEFVNFCEVAGANDRTLAVSGTAQGEFCVEEGASYLNADAI